MKNPGNVSSAASHSTSPSQPQPQPADGYAGDIPAALAWQWVQSDQAVLVDVRTDAEREWVGRVPGAVAVVWRQWPGMVMNRHDDAKAGASMHWQVRAYSLSCLFP